jgi:two-component system response regulator AtoC
VARRILIIDDELDALWRSADLFREQGFEVSTCSQPGRALDALAQHRPDVVLLDVRMPGTSGLEVLKAIRERDRHLCVIMLSAYGDAKTIVSAMKLGADNFAEKGTDPEKLLIVVDKELKGKSMERELASLKAQRGIQHAGIDHIIGESEVMGRVRQRILDYADADCAVLVTGENGTGKDLVAGVLHHESKRRGQPFQHLLCPGIAEGLFESEIFGHERGSFTSAHRSRKGMIEAAGRGTVFLNEIVDIPAYVQAKLLLVIETGVYMRVGGEGRVLKSEARFIAATNHNVRDALETKELREDLYYRLNQASIDLPPLRERGDDIILLANHFLREASQKLERPEVNLSSRSCDLLMRYRWPGNVRELRTIMNRVIMAGSEDVIKGDALLSKGFGEAEGLAPKSRCLKDVVRYEVESTEKRLISEALRRFEGNRGKSARWLDISYRNLLLKMKKYGLRAEF